MKNHHNLERYNRNIIIEKVGIEGQEKLFHSKILIAGCGGLGSTVISTLSSAGIGTIGLIDNDIIEISNLNRQFIHKFENIGRYKVNSAKEWINNYNPEIDVKTHKIRLNADNCGEILSQYDLVVDCFDSYESKFVLNDSCIKHNKILIHGGVSEFWGQVTTIIPNKSACLSCLFNEGAMPSVLKGVISPSVSVIASIQAMEAIKVILGIDDLLINQLLTYDGTRQTFKKINLSPNDNCSACGKLVNFHNK
jgi:molybdopterin-synthase adenylyltransferase